MRYKPERALTLYVREVHTFDHIYSVEMRYKPERALTHIRHMLSQSIFDEVEMRYKPVRALTHLTPFANFIRYLW